MIRFRTINVRVVGVVRSVGAMTMREKQFLLQELVQIRGLMPLLMKPRNKQHWTSDDKAQLREHLRRLTQISPYLVVFVMPGGLLMLPALSWWLDRRRNKQRPLPPVVGG